MTQHRCRSIAGECDEEEEKHAVSLPPEASERRLANWMPLEAPVYMREHTPIVG